MLDKSWWGLHKWFGLMWSSSELLLSLLIYCKPLVVENYMVTLTVMVLERALEGVIEDEPVELLTVVINPEETLEEVGNDDRLMVP
jgi:hypothetical protein